VRFTREAAEGPNQTSTAIASVARRPKVASGLVPCVNDPRQVAASLLLPAGVHPRIVSVMQCSFASLFLAGSSTLGFVTGRLWEV
jgi:hypothetical protein